MLRAGRPEAQVPLLAADRVVALTLGEGAPISEPLVGGPVGRGGQQQGGRGIRGPSGWDTESEGQGETPQFASGETGLGTQHKGTQQFRARIMLRFQVSQLPEPRIAPHTMLPFGSPGAGVEQRRGRGCSRMKRNASESSLRFGGTPLPRITLPTPIPRVGSLPGVPVNVTTQSDLGLGLDLSFRGRVLQDHRASLNPCGRGHGGTVRGRAEQAWEGRGREDKQKTVEPGGFEPKDSAGKPCDAEAGAAGGPPETCAC